MNEKKGGYGSRVLRSQNMDASGGHEERKRCDRRWIQSGQGRHTETMTQPKARELCEDERVVSGAGSWWSFAKTKEWSTDGAASTHFPWSLDTAQDVKTASSAEDKVFIDTTGLQQKFLLQGCLIGKGGENVRFILKETGVQIAFVDKNAHGLEAHLKCHRRDANVSEAKSLLADLLADSLEVVQSKRAERSRQKKAKQSETRTTSRGGNSTILEEGSTDNEFDVVPLAPRSWARPEPKSEPPAPHHLDVVGWPRCLPKLRKAIDQQDFDKRRRRETNPDRCRHNFDDTDFWWSSGTDDYVDGSISDYDSFADDDESTWIDGAQQICCGVSHDHDASDRMAKEAARTPRELKADRGPCLSKIMSSSTPKDAAAHQVQEEEGDQDEARCIDLDSTVSQPPPKPRLRLSEILQDNLGAAAVSDTLRNRRVYVPSEASTASSTALLPTPCPSEIGGDALDAASEPMGSVSTPSGSPYAAVRLPSSSDASSPATDPASAAYARPMLCHTGFIPILVHVPHGNGVGYSDWWQSIASSSVAPEVMGQLVIPDKQEAASPKQSPQQPLERAFCVATGAFHVRWRVDARKLRGDDMRLVSPAFELSLGSRFPNATFKLIIVPKIDWGRHCFRRSKGLGCIKVKCEAELDEPVPVVSFRIHVGEDEDESTQVVSHDFAKSPMFEATDVWDFNTVVEPQSRTCRIWLEVVKSERVAQQPSQPEPKASVDPPSLQEEEIPRLASDATSENQLVGQLTGTDAHPKPAARPLAVQESTSVQHPAFKGGCKYYQRGSCRFGTECRSSHSSVSCLVAAIGDSGACRVCGTLTDPPHWGNECPFKGLCASKSQMSPRSASAS